MRTTIIILLSLFWIITSTSQTQIGNDIDGEAAGDLSGTALDISSDGSIVAIGAFDNDANGPYSGHIRVYQNIAGTWTQMGGDIDGEAAMDESGHSVSLSANGTIVAIGAFNNDGINGANSGHIRVYEYNGSDWTQVGSDIDGEAVSNYSGTTNTISLSANGTIIAIGASHNDGVNGNNSGHVRVYENIAGVWTQIGTDIDGEAANDNSSVTSLSADGSIVAIGAYQNGGNGTNSGHVRVYENIGSVWTQIGADIDGEAAGDQSGWALSLSADGTILAVGAYQNDGNGTNSGHARVYENIAGVWTQIGTDIDGEAAGDQFGYAVDLNADGSILAVGARYNDGASGAFSGQIRIYKNITGVWTQTGNDIDGEAASDRLGYSVKLSSDGSIFAAGAPYNAGINGIDSGHVRVYGYSVLSVEEDIFRKSIVMYPNPTSSAFQVDIKTASILTIYDINSKKVKSFENYQGEKIDISHLNSGFYLVAINEKGRKSTKKLIIK